MDTLKCYEILDVTPEADPQAIRAAYVNLAKIWHPERFQNTPMLTKAEEKMREINEAYHHLASFIPELHSVVPQASESVVTEEVESALVNEDPSPFQWSLVLMVGLIIGLVSVIGYQIYKAEKSIRTASSAAHESNPVSE